MHRFITKDQLERTLSKGEQALNLIGYIPFVSTMSAALRLLGGKLQALLGFVFAAVYFCFLKFSKARKVKHLFYLKSGFSHGMHGIGNIIRSTIEAVPFLSLITCLPYDRFLKIRFRYHAEKFPASSNFAPSDTDIEIEVEEIKN